MNQKLLAFLGIGGSLSCYIAMFPMLFISLLGALGISSTGILAMLTAYQQSFLFSPVFLASLLFLLIAVIPYGKTPLFLALVGSLGVFTSMTFFMQQWLFILSFAVVALAYFLSYRKSRSMPLKLGFILLMFVVFIGILDMSRVFLVAPSSDKNQPVDQMERMMRK